MRASIAPEPKSHFDSKTPITGLVQRRVSVSLDSQSCADAESDHRITPIWLCGQDSSGYRSKYPMFRCQKATWKRTASKGPHCSALRILLPNGVGTSFPRCVRRSFATCISTRRKWRGRKSGSFITLLYWTNSLVVVRPFDPKHPLDHRAGQIASRG